MRSLPEGGPVAGRRGAVLCVSLVAALVLILAYGSPCHDQLSWFDPPGEQDHVVAAAFYLHHVLPPAVDDPAAAPTLIPDWGCSYAHYLDIIYPVAGLLARGLPDALPLPARLRLINLACLLALCAVLVAAARRSLVLLFFFLVTPQVWYMFGFFNGDALPLALGFAAAALLVPPREGPAPLPPARAAGLGALLGLIVLCRQYYWIFAVFAAAALAVRVAAAPAAPAPPAARWRPLLVALLVMAAVVAPRWLYDQAVNGFDKGPRLAALAERTADPAFRHSNLHQPFSEPTLYLREKGVSLLELQRRHHWLELSYASFFGYYGRMILRSPLPYYALAGLLFPASLAVLTWLVLRRGRPADRLIWLLAAGACAMTVIQSLVFSWTANVQPQGRYLFAALPILAVGLAPAFDRLPARWAWGLALTFLALSAWSFAGTALARLVFAASPV